MALVHGILRGIATRPAKRTAMVTHAMSVIHSAAGVDGDFGRRPGRAQVTVLSEQAWRAACEEIGAALPWTMRRANLLVGGIPLQPIKGSRIVIGGVVLEVGAAVSRASHDDGHLPERSSSATFPACSPRSSPPNSERGWRTTSSCARSLSSGWETDSGCGVS